MSPEEILSINKNSSGASEDCNKAIGFFPYLVVLRAADASLIGKSMLAHLADDVWALLEKDISPISAVIDVPATRDQRPFFNCRRVFSPLAREDKWPELAIRASTQHQFYKHVLKCATERLNQLCSNKPRLEEFPRRGPTTKPLIFHMKKLSLHLRPEPLDLTFLTVPHAPFFLHFH